MPQDQNDKIQPIFNTFIVKCTIKQLPAFAKNLHEQRIALLKSIPVQIDGTETMILRDDIESIDPSNQCIHLKNGKSHKVEGNLDDVNFALRGHLNPAAEEVFKKELEKMTDDDFFESLYSEITTDTNPSIIDSILATNSDYIFLSNELAARKAELKKTEEETPPKKKTWRLGFKKILGTPKTEKQSPAENNTRELQSTIGDLEYKIERLERTAVNETIASFLTLRNELKTNTNENLENAKLGFNLYTRLKDELPITRENPQIEGLSPEWQEAVFGALGVPPKDKKDIPLEITNPEHLPKI